jgi:alpha-ketoglutarate-dependent taurine dioxygenase
MYRFARHGFKTYQQLFTSNSSISKISKYGTRHMATEVSIVLPHLEAHDLSFAKHPQHVREVSERLQQNGVLKISLRFPDNDSRYLQQLLLSLHKNHGHQLPITHSETRGWFWDIRPSTTNFQTANHQARSETMEVFPWHTDCSYEDTPPRYFALQVLQPDRYGGGALSIMNVERLSNRLSPATRDALMLPEFQITTPPEFVKNSTPCNVVGSLLAVDDKGRPSMMRFRDDILTPLSERASRALAEIKQALPTVDGPQPATLQLTAKDLPEGAIILVDNRRWLHARTDVKDPERHLRRVRWDAIPFHNASS